MAATEEQVLRLAGRLLGDRELARDAVQEVFLRVFRYLKTFRVGEDFRGWLSRSLLPLSSMSFSESERASLRRRVLDEIGRRREKPSLFAFAVRPGFALAALAGVVVLGAALLSPFIGRNPEPAAALPGSSAPAGKSTPSAPSVPERLAVAH